MNTFKQRASDSLDLAIVVDIGLQRLKNSCKKAVLHSVKSYVERLQKSKARLEAELKVLVETSQSGIIAFFKRSALVKKLKREIAEINMQIVQWINSLYRRYVG